MVDIDDVGYMLLAFADADQCTNFAGADLFPCDSLCTRVDIDDIVTVLRAFAEYYDCAPPCVP